MNCSPPAWENVLHLKIPYVAETNIAPETMGLEDAFPFGKAVYLHQTKQCVTTSMFGRLQWTRNSVASKI